MDKFDLQRALAGEPVCTRDGREVTQLVKFDAPNDRDVVVGVFDGKVNYWSIDGKWDLCSKQLSDFDLLMKHKEKSIIVGSSSHNAIGLHNPLLPDSVKIKNTETMYKFDLQRALSSEAVCTRDGREVTQLTKFDVKNKRCLVGVVDGMLLSWTYKGDCFGKGKESKHDLFMKYAKDELFVFINVYKVTPAMPSEKPYLTIGVYESDKEAKINAITKMEQDSFAEFIETKKITDKPKDL
jgi:hypothetical protein